MTQSLRTRSGGLGTDFYRRLAVVGLKHLKAPFLERGHQNAPLQAAVIHHQHLPDRTEIQIRSGFFKTCRWHSATPHVSFDRDWATNYASGLLNIGVKNNRGRRLTRHLLKPGYLGSVQFRCRRTTHDPLAPSRQLRDEVGADEFNEVVQIFLDEVQEVIARLHADTRVRSWNRTCIS